MKHYSIDLQSEVKRAILPEGLLGFLFPLFEAVSNALHSIEERWIENVEEMGQVVVEFSSADQRIIVADNGVGFDKKNVDAFLTPLTGNKLERGGKGFGRFIVFKSFHEVYYSSKILHTDGASVPVAYRYDPFALDDNLIAVEPNIGAGDHRFSTGVTAMMCSPLPDILSYFDLSSSHYPSGSARDAIASAILDHFLVEFIQKKAPKQFFFVIDGEKISLHDYFNQSLSVGGSATELLSIDGKDIGFKFDYFRVGESQARKHRLYFYSNNRAASELENISSGLNPNPFEETTKDGVRKYYYLTAVSSDFFIASQSRDRITNLSVKVELDDRKKPLKEILIALAKQHILALEREYTAGRRAKMVADVEHLIAVDPLLRRGLAEKSPADFVQRRSITESKEQLAQDLFVERFRKKFDFTKLNAKTSVSELVNIVKTKIPEDAKEALAVYVAYRNHVIQIFRELLNKTEDGLATEDKVHQLIYPRYKDSEEVDYSVHNLWLLDDDLAYAKYISSDRTPDGASRSKGEYAHDLLINNDNELMIVEMKRPQKTGYTVESDSMTNHPVDQLKKQISDIRKKGSVKTSGGRDVAIPANTMVRGYILADWNDSLQNYLAIEDFTITNYGGPMAYRYFKTLNLMIEVIAFDRLVDRASNRNEAFVQILNGNSTSDRKPTSAI